MSPRYVLIVSDHDPQSWPGLEKVVGNAGLSLAFSNKRIAAFTNAACECVSIGKYGCIIGALFRRHGRAEPLTSLPRKDWETIAATNGAMLVREFWGSYVATLSDKDAIRVLRDPSATFPCYFSRSSHAHMFASDAELLADAGFASADVNFAELGRHFSRAGVPSPATALLGINELLAGFVAIIRENSSEHRLIWSPWDHVSDDKEVSIDRAGRLKRIVEHCVRSAVSISSRPLLSVSGGLDSSIVAACLAKAGVEVTCLTMFTDDAGGDERAFARALCDRLRLPLIERPHQLEDIDITKPLAPHLPRPSDRTHALAFERAHLDVAADIGADAFVTGNGGDSVFGYSQSAAAVADRYLSNGLGRGTLSSLLDVCGQTGCSIFDAIQSAWNLCRRHPRHPVLPELLFLHPQVIAQISSREVDHPWLDAPSNALPGRAAHISWILRVQQCLDHGRGRILPLINPLMSQPIIEMCLSVPSWEWREGGRDRAVARLAFASDLPSAVTNRRIKGSPSHFAARLLNRFRPAIREQLLTGWLATERVTDVAALQKALQGERPISDLDGVRILELLAAEAWVGYWRARGKNSVNQLRHMSD